MARRVTIIGFVLLVVAATAIVIPFVVKARHQANLTASQSNLRELALFGAHHAKPDQTPDRASKLPTAIPAGTVVLPGTPPDDRLSWVYPMLPLFDERKNSVVDLFPRIKETLPWSAAPNQEAGRTRLPVLLCPENTPEVPAGAPAVTCYVGVGGVGANAASLPVGAPNAGAFRYDTPTPFDRVADGLSQTLLFAETRNDVGPWLRGGTATVRGLDPAAGAPPLIGGQFGGYFAEGANVAMCDGGVRTFSPRTTPQVFLNLATVAGKETDPVPGE